MENATKQRRSTFAPLPFAIAFLVLVALIVGGLVFYFAGGGSPISSVSNNTATTSQEQSGKGPYWYQGSASLCSQGAQGYADSLSRPISAPMPPVAQFSLSSQQNQNTTVQATQPSNLPALSYFVESSHYAASQNSCYFELHDLLPLPSGGNVDTYTLYVAGGPSESLVSQNAVTSTEIANCSTYPSGQTQCGYYGPMKQEDWIIGGGNEPLWIATYPLSDTNPPPMSQPDFESLVTDDMSAN